MSWRKTASRCDQCKKIRSEKRFIDASSICSTCKFENATQSEYGKCKLCLGWFKGLKTRLCEYCTEKHKIYIERSERKKR